MEKKQKHNKQTNKNKTGSSQIQAKTTQNNANNNVPGVVSVERLSIIPRKRSELNSLVYSVMQIGFKKTMNPREEWQQYVALQKLLDRIQVLEAPLKRKSASGTLEERLKNIEIFNKWAMENGVRYDGLKIAHFEGYDLGLQATRNIKESEQLISIPHKLILSQETISDINHPQPFEWMPNLKLAYVFLLESAKPDSFWKPYIDLLPDKYNTVLYYTVEEMEQLRGSSALHQAIRQCKSIALQYAVIYKSSRKSTNGMTSFGQRMAETFNYDLYRWTVSTVMTRENLIPRQAVGVNDTTADATIAALIPFWDMANHRHGQITSFFNMETNRMECHAQADVNKDEQFFIHYGNRSNADIMIHNGFVDSNNPKDSVAIKLGLSQSDPLYRQRAVLLKMLNVPVNGDLQLLPAPDFISAPLLGFVRVFNMNAEQLEHWMATDRARDLLHIDCAVETSVETKAWQFLRTRLHLLLRAFPTTLDDDNQKWKEHEEGGGGGGGGQLSYIAAMILQYRIIEKKIFTNALDYVEHRLKA